MTVEKRRMKMADKNPKHPLKKKQAKPRIKRNMFMNNMKSSGRQQAAGIFLLKYRKRV